MVCRRRHERSLFILHLVKQYATDLFSTSQQIETWRISSRKLDCFSLSMHDLHVRQVLLNTYDKISKIRGALTLLFYLRQLIHRGLYESDWFEVQDQWGLASIQDVDINAIIVKLAHRRDSSGFTYSTKVLRVSAEGL